MPFIVLSNKDRGLTRINSILKMFDIEDRLVSDLTLDEIPQSSICWEKVNSQKVKLQKFSINFLRNALL